MATEHTYEAWRHGGWYVTDCHYPGGGCGCVSRNFPDRKWRAVCAELLGTFRTRDEAADAECAYAAALDAITCPEAVTLGHSADHSLGWRCGRERGHDGEHISSTDCPRYRAFRPALVLV